FGVHSRIDETIDRATAASAAGNQYVNRNMIGAVVGVQPFGGHGLSGTGPKAGGPLYVHRLLAERPAVLPAAGARARPGPESATLICCGRRGRCCAWHAIRRQRRPRQSWCGPPAIGWRPATPTPIWRRCCSRDRATSCWL